MSNPTLADSDDTEYEFRWDGGDRPRAFAQIPQWILNHPEISHDAIRTWLVIALIAADKKRLAGVSVRMIASETDKSRQTVLDHMNELEAIGALQREVRYRPDSGHSTTLCILAREHTLRAEKPHSLNGAPR